jgi:hypothetical protein
MNDIEAKKKRAKKNLTKGYVLGLNPGPTPMRIYSTPFTEITRRVQQQNFTNWACATTHTGFSKTLAE